MIAHHPPSSPFIIIIVHHYCSSSIYFRSHFGADSFRCFTIMSVSQTVLGMRSGVVVAHAEERRLFVVASALVDFSRQQRNEFLHSHAQQPIMEFYASDGTSHRTLSKYVACTTGSAATRFGPDTKEWLVERIFLVAMNGDSHFLCTDARVMSCKSGWAHYNCYAAHAMARQSHRTWMISHHCWDGAVRGILERLVRTRHVAYGEFWGQNSRTQSQVKP